MPDVIPYLPPRPETGHKGDFGIVAVVGGCGGPSPVMLGAPVLAGLATLRSGAGRCLLAVPTPLVKTALSLAPVATGWAIPCGDDGEIIAATGEAAVMGALASATVAVVGPGLGRSDGATAVVKAAVAWKGGPLIIDADAIAIVADHLEWVQRREAETILTPHGGECQRLMAAQGIKGDVTDDADRIRIARELATALGCIIVLKGPRTVVTDGEEVFVNPTGSVAMATGGSGDVLAGVIGGFAGQWVASGRGGMSMAAGSAAVWAHGAAADAWSSCHGDAGMLATDLLATLPKAMMSMARGPTHA